MISIHTSMFDFLASSVGATTAAVSAKSVNVTRSERSLPAVNGVLVIT